MNIRNKEFVTQYKLEDFFIRTFKMFKLIWGPSILVSLFFIPFIAAYSLLVALFINISLNLSINMDKLIELDTFSLFGTGINNNLILIYIFLIITSLLYIVVFYFVKTFITIKTYNYATQNFFSLKQILVIIFKKKSYKILLQLLLKTAIFLILFLIFATLCFLLIWIIFNNTQFNSPNIFNILMVVGVVLIFFGYIISSSIVSKYLYFSLEALILDNTTIVDGLLKSYNFVTIGWWRVFGISTVFSMAVSFGISFIITPLFTASVIPILIHMYQGIINYEIKSLSDIFNNYLLYFTIIIGIALLIHNLIYTILNTIFNTLFYIDLKIRKKDLKIKRTNNKKSNNQTTKVYYKDKL